MKDNKLIAEFMGAEPDKKTFFLKGKEVYFYHTSWDWLMPVVEKCFEVAYDGQMVDIMHHLQVADIERTYEEVVEFIEEYNVQLEKDIKNGLYGEQ
tara:strand:- start:39 stop:326 length:288 start_codon:yes stop_codon:yes gene_type:complete